ncbi:MAG: hypothetical protein A2Y62_06430 [Candidatus Fischerbacteria bacterium RBG_13_37_8]|uniref:Helix-turn-helix domain-containing protein n=1 Tax=Candidatus Fischerbacteria bacterium RBG_13_37_8 TaxID=1817863 RepID=A0A1F5VQJ0_9BACT|nr:MAG: hypothetical protein A2Y62_06430 [Candidatus Fischerbacteria bacterium RBG_13_37_8]
MKEIEGIKLYTIQEIAEMLKVHPLTIQRKVKKGIIKGVKINKSWYISSDNLKSFLQGNTCGSEPKGKKE